MQVGGINMHNARHMLTIYYSSVLYLIVHTAFVPDVPGSDLSCKTRQGQHCVNDPFPTSFDVFCRSDRL